MDAKPSRSPHSSPHQHRGPQALRRPRARWPRTTPHPQTSSTLLADAPLTPTLAKRPCWRRMLRDAWCSSTRLISSALARRSTMKRARAMTGKTSARPPRTPQPQLLSIARRCRQVRRRTSTRRRLSR
jgi:hypothetical protein